MMAESLNDSRCRICGGGLALMHAGLAGYQDGRTYDVLVCTSCNLSVVEPLVVDEALYDLIYSCGHHVPGYDRYHEYALGVERSAEPLRYLAACEDMYWGVARALDSLDLGADAEVLEVGSGLGYLTFSLSKRFRAMGIDLSSHAVDASKARYGDLFRMQNVRELGAGRFDVVIATEVIEHVIDPVTLIRDMVRVLKPGGTVIITTPNKSHFPVGSVWETELPPVHLWWFAEESVSAIARQANTAVRFIDFTDFNRERYCNVRNAPTDLTTRRPIFSRDGRLLPSEGAFSRALRRCGLYYVARNTRDRIIASLPSKYVGKRRGTLCAVLQPL